MQITDTYQTPRMYWFETMARLTVNVHRISLKHRQKPCLIERQCIAFFGIFRSAI